MDISFDRLGNDECVLIAVPWFRLLFAGPSPRRSRFHSGLVNERLRVTKVKKGLVSLRLLGLVYFRITPPVL